MKNPQNQSRAMSTENTGCVENPEMDGLVDEALLRATQLVYAKYETHALFSDGGISDFSDPTNKVLDVFKLRLQKPIDVDNSLLASRYCSMDFPEHVRNYFLGRRRYPITQEQVISRISAAFEQTRGRGLTEAEGKQVWWIWKRYFFIIPERVKSLSNNTERRKKASVNQLRYLCSLIQNEPEISDPTMWLLTEQISIYLIESPANPFISSEEASQLIDFLKLSSRRRQQGYREKFARKRPRYVPY